MEKAQQKLDFFDSLKRLPRTGRRWGYSGLHRDEGGQLGDQHQTDDGDARASHELLHARALCLCVIKKQ